MLLNTAWLLEYLEPPCSESDLLRAFLHMGLEVEAIHPLARELEHIRIGFIRDKTPLPGTDGMFICRAEVGPGETLQVVCASEHPIEIGWGVPIARGGTKLPTGIPIKSGTFHGALSEGMICLDSELGMLASGSGLQVFRDEAAIGQRLVDLIDIQYSILDVKATANRPDWLSLIGIAREVAAVLGLSLKLPPSPVEEAGASTASLAKVEIKEPALCRRYVCRLIKGVKIAKSPAWLSSRLRSSGSNPINNVVDVTNLVMREWGQPLHAFDFHTLSGAQIIVRKMLPSESLELIDGTWLSGQSQLRPDGLKDPDGSHETAKSIIISEETAPLVIADAERPVALAGIMGGRATQINNETVDVLLEAAYFDPVQIKKSLRELGLNSTDASYRFERGMDPNETLEMAIERAASLIVLVAGGTIAREPLDVYVNKMERKTFQLTPERVSSYLGTPVSDSTIKDCLQRLEMKCSDDLVVEVPTRRVDVNNPVVLIEDVARLTGYDQIPLTRPVGNLTSGKRNSLDVFRRRVMLFLADSGFLESRNLSLESPKLILEFSREVEDAVALVNSREEISLLRKSLLPGLLETIGRNARRDAENYRYFELDRTFRRAPDSPSQSWTVAAVAGGLTRDVDWSASKLKLNFFHMKGVVESLFETVDIKGVTFRPASRPGFMEGQTAEVLSGSRVLGVVGAIDGELLSSRKIKESVYAFELSVESMMEASGGVQTFQDIPRTPAVVRDIAVVLDTSIPYAKIEERILEAGGVLLESARCIDVYEGKNIENGNRSISVRLRFRDPQRTLEANEVSLAVDHVISILTQQYGAKLRQ